MKLLLLLAPFVSLSMHAQAASTPPPQQLTPKAAYAEAMHPLEVTRHSIANWSDVEIEAMKVTVGRAATECAARDAKSFAGDELIDYARLCAVGQAWPTVVDAASRYIEATAKELPSKPLLNQAYAAVIDAQLHMKDEPNALKNAKAMLAVVPYDTLTAETIDEALDYMQFVDTGDALELATLREPLLLNKVAALAKAPASASPAATSDEPPQTLHQLYQDGLSLAAVQQLAKVPLTQVGLTVAALDAALPTALAPDDALPIAAARRRYALLGSPLPAVMAKSFLMIPGRMPQIPAVNAVTALMLFPDWCAQCVRMGTQFPETVFLINNQEAYFYGVLAETVPPNKPAPPANPAVPIPPTPANAEILLTETPTLVVSPKALDQFAAADVPFLVIADTEGIVRVAQRVEEDALTSGGTVDSAIGRVVAQWPNPRLKPKPPTPAPVTASPAP